MARHGARRGDGCALSGMAFKAHSCKRRMTHRLQRRRITKPPRLYITPLTLSHTLRGRGGIMAANER